MDAIKISVKDGKPCEKILTIEVEQPTIEKEYDQFYQAIAHRAKVPGFRPGKIPRQILTMHYQKEAREAVLKNLISDSLRQAFKEKDLSPLIMPEIQEVDFKETGLSYQARLEIRPKIKISRISGFKVKKETAAVTDQDVEETLAKVRESLAHFKAVEDRPARMGDFVIADHTCFVDGKEAEKRSGDWFELKDEEFLKGFSSQLVGIKPEEEREVRITFPEKMAKPEWSGKPAVFKVKVKEIKEKTLPEMNDDLAREAGEYKTMAELRERVKADLLARKEREKDAEYEKALLRELVKQNKIDLPETLVHKRAEHLLERAHENAVRQGMPAAQFEAQKEKARGELETEARYQIHLAFLLDEIAGKENLSVSEEDVKQRYQRIAEGVRQPVEEVQKYYAGNEDAIDSLKDQIRNEKTIEFIKQAQKS